MDCFNLKELLSYQVAHTKLGNYEDEFLTLLAMRNSEGCAIRQCMYSAWISASNRKDVSRRGVTEAMIDRSTRLREEGNVIFKSKSSSNRKGNILDAGRHYTQAILAAPECTEALALAHANRALVLQEFGYYQQAYDDCLCALETGQYPTRLMHKIKTRQAYCAWHLKDVVRLEEHLSELDETNLNDNFTQHMDELRNGLCGLQLNAENSTMENTSASEAKSGKDKTQIVASSDGIRGHCMIAVQPIRADELVFNERISSFVPVDGSRMCQQCGVTLLIPFPCHSCYGHVIYCSMKCRQLHVVVHQYECVGYRWELFDQMGISHLVLRVVLQELPCVVSQLQHLKDAASIWFELTSSMGIIQRSVDINYSQTLRMCSHLAHFDLQDISWFATMAEFLVIYLKEYTNFFDVMNKTEASRSDWELITAALILKHTGQLMVNAHTCVSLAPVCQGAMQPEDSGFLLMNEIWSEPFHAGRGHLHKFADYREISAANLPYLSVCNHACAPSFRPNFSGRYFYALANKNIRADEEIFNCYTFNYKMSLKEQRRAYLKETYHFDCKCEICESPIQNTEYEKYHRYKCRNPKCRTTFVPISTEDHPLSWWLEVDENNVAKQPLRCPSCGEEQSTTWFTQFKQLLPCVDVAKERATIFRLCKTMEKFLLDYHSLRTTLCLELVVACFDWRNGITTLTNDEFEFITTILKYCLRGIADQCGDRSIEYVASMTYMWDLIALKKYQCTNAEMEDMLSALEAVSEEYKTVFLNYYSDYLCNLLVTTNVV